MEGVISVLPNQILELHTTRSWDFMGFPSKGKVGSPHEGDVIIGLLDTGHYIKHTIVIILLRKNTKQMLKFAVFLHLLSCRNMARSDSFNDEGLSSPPSRWKGKCQGANLTCNK